EAVELRHLDVEQQHVGGEPADELDRLGAVARLPRDLDVGVTRGELAQREPAERFVIGDHRAHHDASVCSGSGTAATAPPLPPVTVTSPRSPYSLRSRSPVLRSPTPSSNAGAGPGPSSRTVSSRSSPCRAAPISSFPDRLRRDSPWRNAFSTSGCSTSCGTS